jgi:hypothetical protein
MPKSLLRASDDDHPSSGGPYRAFDVSLPVLSMGSDRVVRMELNLQGKASIALEGMMQTRHEDVDPKTQSDTGESMISDAQGAALFVSRYTQPMTMSGFYWSLGAGYRQQNILWRVRPDGTDDQVNTQLLDSDQMLNHEAVLRGGTGHGRVGYRYSGTEVPLMIGAYGGVRHFQASVRDKSSLAADGARDGTTYAPMTDMEKDRLLRLYQTAPEVGLELGFLF